MENRSLKYVEVQIDRLVGPTHHFGGLGIGNVASQSHAGQRSHPAAAVIQGIEKMRLVSQLGVPQWILPPQARPDFAFLRSVGFGGTDADVLKRALDTDPGLLSAANSSSAMWTANAATVTPMIDAVNPTVTTSLTVANLNSSLHRAIEPDQTFRDLRHILPPSCRLFPGLPGGTAMRDEGAANHMRLFDPRMDQGVHVMVYGDLDPSPSRFFPRQSKASFQAIVRQHQLDVDTVVTLKQHPKAIDAGAFHNDVVAMSHQNLMIHHESAFDESTPVQSVDNTFLHRTGMELRRIMVPESELSIEDAISTYLFNSQIVSPVEFPDRRTMIAPSQVADHPAAKRLVDRWIAEGDFAEVRYVELGQSMSGGGGPACLRLRVPMPLDDAMDATGRQVGSGERFDRLTELANRWYPAEVTVADLARVDFAQHAMEARRRMAVELGAGKADPPSHY